jgi:hypothetical protein
MPGTSTDTITSRIPEPVNIDVSADATQEPPGLMDPLYYQCRSARLAGFRDNLISISVDDTLGKKILAPSPVIGTFETHIGIEKTFHGSRVLKGSSVVNQSISCSFDPSNLVCVSCGNDHKIISSSPVVFVFADQNFVPSLSDNHKSCINITRIENATLTELLEVSREILDHVPIPEGSVMLFGTISHLARVGTSIYASDWTKLVSGLSRRWRGARICPLIPLIGTDCPDSLSREITELSVWFSTMYEGSHLDMSDVWAGVVAAVEEFSAGATPLSNTETYKLPLPSSLNSSSMDMTATFCSIKSCPVVLNGFPKDKQNDLLWSLLDCLCNDFHVCKNQEDYLQRVVTAPLAETTSKEQKVILVGASNLGIAPTPFAILATL